MASSAGAGPAWRGYAVSEILAELLSSKVRAAVLEYIVPRPHLALSLTDLSRALDLPISSLQHECYKLERLGFVTAQRDGAARRYHLNPAAPLVPQLMALVNAAVDREAALRAALDGVSGLELVFLAGERCLVAVGTAPLAALADVTARLEAALALPAGALELAFFRPDDWRQHLRAGTPYVAELLARPRTLVYGPRDDLLPAHPAARDDA